MKKNNMAFLIKIKGGESIHISETQGVDVKDRWIRWIENGKKRDEDEIFEAGEWTGSLSEIKSLERIKEAKNTTSVNASDVHREYMEERRKFLQLPIEDKAKRLEFFKLMGKVFGIDDEIITSKVTDAIDLQRKFFTAHPKRMIADPEIFKDLIGDKNANKFSLPLIARIISEDKYHSV